MRFDLVVERLANLPDPLPAPADVLMPVVVGEMDVQARTRDVAVPGRAPRPAAVLALVYPDGAGVAHIVLTERAARDGHHSGEVSFPGGAAEPEDADIAATALREAAEEVALDPVAAGVQIVARLDRFVIPVSDFEVHPVVAVAARRPALVASPAEVARIVEPRLDRFVPGAPITIVERTIGDWPLRYGAYDVEGLSVWGATARILSQLGAAVAE
ncbi:MAG TPA: CoA pyrophosphatase [Actinomycetota bacterium]|nr:CoA pyrophosphatase [Actinomycetota bacterium]